MEEALIHHSLYSEPFPFLSLGAQDRSSAPSVCRIGWCSPAASSRTNTFPLKRVPPQRFRGRNQLEGRTRSGERITYTLPCTIALFRQEGRGQAGGPVARGPVWRNELRRRASKHWCNEKILLISSRTPDTSFRAVGHEGRCCNAPVPPSSRPAPPPSRPRSCSCKTSSLSGTHFRNR